MVMILIFIFEALIYLSYVIAHNTVYGLLKIIIWFSGPVFRLLFSIVTKYPSLALLLVTFWIHRKPVWIFLVQSWVLVKSLIRQPLSFTSTRLSKRVVPCLIWLWHLFVCLSFYPHFGQGRKVPKQIKLKLAVDRERNRVLFAESDKDFVDILFSFLTLPIGTIIRLAERRSGIGCMDYLYKSVEALDEQFLETKACKTMLLNPRSAYDVHCRNLALKIDGTEPAKHYTCSKMFCSTKAQKMEGFRLASMVKNSVCSCGRAMDKEVFLEYQENVTDGDGVFMKGTRRFTITDNLHITPISMSHSLAMFQKLRLESGNGIEALTVTVDEEEVLYLLKRSLVSKTPMTESFLSNEENTENAASSSRSNHHETRSQRPSHKFRKMKVKLLIDKSSRRVLCLEAKEDFVNLVLSFLTFPLGSIIKLLRGHSSLGCMDNLYRSVGSSKLEDCFKSTKCKEMLLSPKLQMDFGLDQSLPIREEDPATYRSYKCSDCFRKNMVCLYPWHEKLCFMNPKLPGQAVSGGGFIKKETLLLINDDLTIQPLSPINGILDLDKLRVLVSNSEEHEVEVGEDEFNRAWIESIIRQPLVCPSKLCEWIGPFLFWFWHHFSCISSNPRLHRARETPKQISLKLAIDKEKNQVLFAESDIDFVDALFSFLTLPMGTILRLANKKSGVGCMDYLYKNVEALDEQFLQSKECNTMLLNPRSAHDIHCKNLILKIDDTEPTKIYMCSKLFCPIKTPNKKAYCLSSMVENSKCSCGHAMDKEVFLEYQEGIIDGNGVFMKGTSRMFMITDDLHITPVCMSDSLAMFQKLRLESGNGIEVRTVTVHEEEVLHLLKHSLLFKTPMTDTFLSNEENTENAAPFEPLSRPNHLENRFRKMKVKLLINKSSRRVLCLEAKEDFMNLVLSFLTLPLGSIIRLLRGHSSLGSVDNLYKSVGSSKMEDFFNSTKSKDLLLNPKLPLHFSLNEQLPLKEEDPITHESRRCADCFRKNMVYLYPWGEKLCFMNPKLSGQEARGGGFIKKETLLLINDDLTIQPLSPINDILDLDKLKVLVSNSEEHEVEVGEEEALTLLKASLISRSVLNHVFKPNDLGQMLG